MEIRNYRLRAPAGIKSSARIRVSGGTLNRLRKFIEQGPYGEGPGRSAYAFEAATLPAPAAGMKWHPVADFSAAEELLQDPDLKAVFKAALDNGYAVLFRSKD